MKYMYVNHVNHVNHVISVFLSSNILIYTYLKQQSQESDTTFSAGVKEYAHSALSSCQYV